MPRPPEVAAHPTGAAVVLTLKSSHSAERISGTGSALARSWLSWGNPLDAPRYGCVAVLTADDAVEWKGHVGFFIRSDADNVYLFGGNQLGEVRELAYPLERVLAYRWP